MASSYICRFYASGFCRSGFNCRFAHVMDNVDIFMERSRKPCPYNAQGNCAFGDGCRYLHVSAPRLIGLPSNGNAANAEGASIIQDDSNPVNNTENADIVNDIVPNDSGLESEDSPSGNTGEHNNIETTGAAAVPPDLPACHKIECYRGAAKCGLVHMDKCWTCKQRVLDLTDEEQRRAHMEVCTFARQYQREQHEMAEGEARSVGKTCGVCFEVVTEQASGPQRFGILPNCNHCFCLHCIRKWRHQKQFDNTIIRACPECRVASDFVCPSPYWVNTQVQKDKLIIDYKNALCIRNCKYFNSGRGVCPFGNKCFYRHAYPDGTAIDVGPPRVGRRTNRSIADFLEPDYLELHELLYRNLNGQY